MRVLRDAASRKREHVIPLPRMLHSAGKEPEVQSAVREVHLSPVQVRGPMR